MDGKSLTKHEILESIEKSKNRLQALGIRTIGLFGSFVRGDETMQSDIDLLVEFDADKKTFDNFIDACFYLEDLLHRKVELVTRDSLSPYLKPHIEKEIEYVPLGNH
jgi:predicted nucleotidyltransferase